MSAFTVSDGGRRVGARRIRRGIPATNEWEGVGFQPPFSEGHEEAMEFANGQIGILEVTDTSSTTVNWFTVNYQPLGDAGGFRTTLVTVKPLR